MSTRTMLELVLDSDLGDTPSVITSDCTVRQARCISLKNSFTKKWIPDDTRAQDEAALALFVQCNERCTNFALKPSAIMDDLVIGEVKFLLDNICFTGPRFNLRLDTIWDQSGIGPGSSRGCRDESFYTKLFNSPLTATNPYLHWLYRQVASSHPTRFTGELVRSEQFGSKVISGSSLSFVPKTSAISRTICTEPTLNMFFQKWIGHFLEGQLTSRYKIRLDRQPEINKDLARLGSIDGSFGTIDLSSASDSISMNLVKELFPASFCRQLFLARSDNTTLPNGSIIQLDMISSMGNGFTFPLQTIIFASLVVAVYRVMGIKPTYDDRGPSNFGVFGDDIIVRRDAYDYVCHCLELFGFSVNNQKSFNTGHFRESCGGDFYKGHDIRGVYLKGLHNAPDVCSAFNRIIRWSGKSGVALPSTARYLYRSVPKALRLHVPSSESDIGGFKFPKWVLGHLVLRAERIALKSLTRYANEWNASGPPDVRAGRPRLLRDNSKSRPRERLFTPRFIFAPEQGNGQPVPGYSFTCASRTERPFPPWIHGDKAVASPVSEAATIIRGSRSRDQEYPCGYLGLEYAYFERSGRSISYPVFDDEHVCTDPALRYNGAGILLGMLGGFIRNGRCTIRSNRSTVKVKTRRALFAPTDPPEVVWDGVKNRFEFALKPPQNAYLRETELDIGFGLCLTTVELMT